LKRTVYQTPPGGDSAIGRVADDKPPVQWNLLPGPRSIRVGSQRVPTVGRVRVFLPVDVLPDCVNVAGINFHLEADPTVVSFVGVQATIARANEDLHFHSPRPGALNVVFFTNPVQSMSPSGAAVLMLEILVTPPGDAEETLIDVTAAALSDINGASAPEVSGESGHLYFKSAMTDTFDWSLYP